MTGIIYTVGHSTRTIIEFCRILQSFHVEVLVDIRSYPGSKKYPQFNSSFLDNYLKTLSIRYYHLGLLGGRRTPKPDSKNTAWKNKAFRGYADYMETEDFINGINELEKIAHTAVTAIMCSEAVWWRCHRALVADFLKAKGWQVMHLMSESAAKEHPYTSPARIIHGKLNYSLGQTSLL